MGRVSQFLLPSPLGKSKDFWATWRPCKLGSPWSEGLFDNANCSQETKGKPSGASSNLMNICKALKTVPGTEVLAVTVAGAARKQGCLGGTKPA